MIRFITDGTSVLAAQTRYLKRREWLMNQCNGPIVLSSPAMGPNQRYPWAHCDAPVYQDSYILYLTGMNQYPLRIVLDPTTEHHHIFCQNLTLNVSFGKGIPLHQIMLNRILYVPLDLPSFHQGISCIYWCIDSTATQLAFIDS